MTLAARPAIVIPTAVTAWKVPVKHPLIMNAAELLCLREELGFSQEALARAIGRAGRNVRKWEAATQAVSRESADALIDLIAYTDAAVDALVEAAPDKIVIYRTDAEFRVHEDTNGRVLSAEWHRRVAARAAKLSGATVIFRTE